MMVRKGEGRGEGRVEVQSTNIFVQVTQRKQHDFTNCEDDKILACTLAMRRTNSTL